MDGCLRLGSRVEAFSSSTLALSRSTRQHVKRFRRHVIRVSSASPRGFGPPRYSSVLRNGMERSRLAHKPAERGRPVWGFARVDVESICRLWTAYREGELKRQDVQTWFAVHELLMRRCTLRAGRSPKFSKRELEPLTGFDACSVRASLRRLEGRGFLSWSEQKVSIFGGSELMPLASLPAILSLVTNHRRTLPIPRHTVLLLAGTRRPVMLATILGHLLRCMYYRSRECVSWGTCKASWIAETFGVDARNVKAARGELERSEWLRQLDSHHWHRQRYGGTFVVSLAWAGSRSRTSRVSPPRKSPQTTKSPPPDSYRNLPTGIKNQKRPDVPRPGVQGQRAKREGEPNLLHVMPGDLADPNRTAALFRQAVAKKLILDTSSNRLQFFAAAERAKRLGNNPGGFFAAILKKGLWKNIANCDEERARRGLASVQDALDTVREPRRTAAVGKPNAEIFDEAETDPMKIRELVRRSLASAVIAPAGSLTRSSPSHLVLEGPFSAERNGVKEGTHVPMGRRP